MEILARVRIVVWEGASLWVTDATPVTGPGPRRTDPHAHHAIQITIGLGGEFGLGETACGLARGGAVAVAADAEHVFEAEGLVAHLFIEPESKAGRAVAQRFLAGGPVARIPADALEPTAGRIAANFRAPVRDDAALIELGRDLVARLSAGAVGERPDARIARVIDWAGKQIDRQVTLSDAVALGTLSAGRLRHLFVEQTGLPFKTFLLWLRLTRAVESFASGASLTEAAHESGFSDSAHFSRTFRRMFGIAPTALRLS